MALSKSNSPPSDFTVVNTSSGPAGYMDGKPYVGPLNWLTTELIFAGGPSLSIEANIPNVFIHTGEGNDAINVAKAGGGNNVMDGGTGSNFLVGGKGDDAFFLDDRQPTAPTWSTIVGFHQGDSATIWGVTPQDFTLTWLDNQGAAGFKGLTLRAEKPNVPDANLTISGYTSADLANGKLHVTFGTTDTVGGVRGSSYMQIN